MPTTSVTTDVATGGAKSFYRRAKKLRPATTKVASPKAATGSAPWPGTASTGCYAQRRVDAATTRIRCWNRLFKKLSPTKRKATTEAAATTRRQLSVAEEASTGVTKSINHDDICRGWLLPIPKKLQPTSQKAPTTTMDASPGHCHMKKLQGTRKKTTIGVAKSYNQRRRKAMAGR